MSANPGFTGRYELQELLGQSEMSEVWKAFDTQTRQYVAIKFLHADLRVDPDFAARFQREAQTIAALHHPNIIRYQDFFIAQPPGTGNATGSVIMDYVDGGTLDDYIGTTSRQGKFLATSDIVALFTSFGAALDYAHQHGVVHGRLKPTNILLDRRNPTRNLMGEPLVTDFGMAGLLAANGNGGPGTPLYVSPEQIMGGPGDMRSDVYALGIMLYEIVAGTPPFPGSNPATIMTQHLNTIPASPALINPDASPELVTIIMRSIAKDPALRFPDASALLAELARVSGASAGAPIAVNAGLAEPAINSNLPTILSAGQLSPLPGMLPSASLPSSLPGISGAGLSPLPGYGPPSFPGLAGVSFAPAVSGPATPMPATFSSGQIFSSETNVLPPPAPAPRRTRRRGLWIALSVLLALLLIGSGLGFYLMRVSSAAGPMIVGHAYFVSSGLLSSNPETVQGITDQLELNLGNIPPPQPNKNYYAWLLNDKTLEWKPIALGALTVNNGTITLAYPGDAQHSNLLATNSRFLITEEDAASPPANPSLSSADWRYYAEFSQVKHPDGANQYSLYDHIRHLLADDPTVKATGLSGGLDIWLYRDTEKILEWSSSARDADQPAARNIALIRRQLTRIIDYLDGVVYAQRDLPGQPILADPTISRIGLLTFDPANQTPPGYLYHIGKHLYEIAVLPEASSAQKALATQVNGEINNVNAWDEQMRTDALKLFQMSDEQLAGSQGLSLLDEVATLANAALVGQVNPQGSVTAGVVQIHYAIQSLATFNVRACTTSDPCPALI